MLMKTTMKTAAELGLTKEFYQGLLKFQQALKADEFVDWKAFKKSFPNSCKGLTMGIVLQRDSTHECRTVGCILGWSRLFSGEDNVHIDNITQNQDIELSHLICPPNWGIQPYTLDQIEHAVDTYLYTGHAEW